MCASWCTEAARGAEGDRRKTRGIWRSHCPPHVPELSQKPHRACTEGMTEQGASQSGAEESWNLLSLVSFLMPIHVST